MRQGVILVAAMLVGSCGGGAVSPSPIGTNPAVASPAVTPRSTSTPVSPTSNTASPSATPLATDSASPAADARWLEAARAYAIRAGFELAPDGTALVEDARPSYDQLLLHHVSLPLAGVEAWMALDVYLDDAGAIRVVEDQRGDQSTGKAIARSDVSSAVSRQLDLAGVDAADTGMHVVSEGAAWFVTLDRAIDGHPVANTPMAWGLTGDKAYVELRADGTLVALYAIWPDHQKQPAILPSATLDMRLAAAAKVSRAKLATYRPALLWVRASNPELAGGESTTLSLGYCATNRFESGWEAWCVDAGTGAAIVHAGASD